MDVKKDNYEHIEKWNRYYFINKKSVPWNSNVIDSHIIDFYNFNNFKVGNKILDVGCGYGKNSGIFSENNLVYYGIDIAKEPINFANENFKGGFFLLGDVLKFDFKNIKFNCIVDAGCIHVNNKSKIKDFLNKYFELLLPNGRIFIRLFKSKNKTNEPIFLIDNYLPVWGYTKMEIIKLFSKLFFIEKIIFDDKYYEEDELFYLYLRKKNI